MVKTTTMPLRIPQPSSSTRSFLAIAIMWLRIFSTISHGFQPQTLPTQQQGVSQESFSHARKVRWREGFLTSSSPSPHGRNKVLISIHRAVPGNFQDESNSPTKKRAAAKGVYARPSAAIEKGSGFFVPGLEGPKVRLAVGLILLALVAVNFVGSSSGGVTDTAAAAAASANLFSEALAAIFSLFVLFQGGIEYTKDLRESSTVMVGRSGRKARSSSVDGASSARSSYRQQWSLEVDADWRSRIEWAAATYLSLTPATHIMLIGPGKILYWLGMTPQPTAGDAAGTDEQIISEGCVAALSSLDRSASGRVALPETHPAAAAIFPAEGSSQKQKCVVLQRIGDKDQQLCWMMASDQLLASFTRQDLQWLGELSRYVKPPAY